MVMLWLLNDAMVIQSDLNLLDAQGWINDAIIHFHSELLISQSNTKKKVKCCLLSPTIVLLLSTYIDASLGPPDLLTADAVFIPINDSESTDSGGGSHWRYIRFLIDSLLVYNKRTQIFYYYDSLDSRNQERRAREIAAAFVKIIGLNELTVVKVPTPHQVSGIVD